MINCNDKPLVLGNFELKVPEVMYYLYLPISLPDMESYVIPKKLKVFEPLIQQIQKDEPERFKNEFVYLTCKRMFVGPILTANRLGWHADGFLTDDLNYIWFDSLPTLFNSSNFSVTEDHKLSLVEFEKQALVENNFTCPNNHLVKLTSKVVHAVQEAKNQFMRTFCKISVSKHKFNAKDNSINHQLNYNWETFERNADRNSENKNT